jgi:hypothetical protein
VLGLAMVAAGALVDVYGARWILGGASVAFLLAAACAAVLAKGVGGAAEEARLEELAASRV